MSPAGPAVDLVFCQFKITVVFKANQYTMCPSLVESKIGKITGQRIATFLYVIFAVLLLTVDEFLIGLAMYKSQRALEKLTLDGPFNALPVIVQNQLSNYYNTLSKHNSRRLTIMARESSIQLIYQNAIIVYEFVHPSTLGMYYQDWGSYILLLMPFFRRRKIPAVGYKIYLGLF